MINTKIKYVYICHPLRGDIDGNLAKVRGIVRQVCSKEVIAFAPHFAFGCIFPDHDPVERHRGIEYDLALLTSGKIDEIWVYGERLSEGMRMEIEACQHHGIPIHCKEPKLQAQLTEFLKLLNAPWRQPVEVPEARQR